MDLQIDYNETREIVRRQLANLFGYDPAADDAAIAAGLHEAIRRCGKCFAAIKNKYYQRNGKLHFNPFHSGQYCIFLYYLSNSVWSLSPWNRSLADRIFYLNKTLNGLDLYYEVEMPEVFFLDHAVGSVLGRAKYGNYFTFSQNCTVGNNKGFYPQFGENVYLMSGANVLGNSVIGDHVILSANCYVKDQDIPHCSVVFGSSPHLIIKRKDRQYFLEQMKFFVPPQFLAPPGCG